MSKRLSTISSIPIAIDSDSSLSLGYLVLEYAFQTTPKVTAADVWSLMGGRDYQDQSSQRRLSHCHPVVISSDYWTENILNNHNYVSPTLSFQWNISIVISQLHFWGITETRIFKLSSILMSSSSSSAFLKKSRQPQRKRIHPTQFNFNNYNKFEI